MIIIIIPESNSLRQNTAKNLKKSCLRSFKRNSGEKQVEKYFRADRGKEDRYCVVPPRIELGYQVPETCVLSIVLRDRNDAANVQVMYIPLFQAEAI